MNTPEWLKPGIYGAIVGAVCFGVIGFTWGGWITGETAENMASTMAQDRLITAMVPVCLDMARTDTERSAKLAKIRAASTYQRRGALMETGWATVPGTEDPDRDIAEACLKELKL
jgi:hypothetical protein